MAPAAIPEPESSSLSGCSWRSIHLSTPIAATRSTSSGRGPNASRFSACTARFRSSIVRADVPAGLSFFLPRANWLAKAAATIRAATPRFRARKDIPVLNGLSRMNPAGGKSCCRMGRGSGSFRPYTSRRKRFRSAPYGSCSQQISEIRAGVLSQPVPPRKTLRAPRTKARCA